MRKAQWTATLLVALACLGAMGVTTAEPVVPANGMAEVGNGSVTITWSTPARDIIVQSGCTATNLSVGPVAEEFMNEHPTFDIRLTGGTNDLAFAELIEGRSDIAQASRSINAEEKRRAEQEGLRLVDIMIGAEAVAVMVNPGLGVEGLSMEQLRGIYDGSITTWSEVGGPDVPVDRVGALTGTNAYNLINYMALNQSGYASMPQYAHEDIPSEVMGREGGIGFLLHGQVMPAHEDMVIGIASSDGGRYVMPSEETAFSSAYPLARPFRLITNGAPDGAVGSWIGYILDQDGGQSILRENGFYPLTDEERESGLKAVAGGLNETLSFHVYRSYEGTEERFIVNGTTFTDEAPPLGVAIKYQVSSVIDGAESGRSAPMEVTVPEPTDGGGEGYVLPMMGIAGAVGLVALAIWRRR